MPLPDPTHGRPRSLTREPAGGWPPERQTPGLALIMPVHGPLAAAAPALGALEGLVPAPDEIIVVVDVPCSPADAALLPAGARVVFVPHACGPARARNAGAAAAVASTLFFVDADVVVPTDTVARVMDGFARHPGVTALFGSYDARPGDPSFLSQYRNLMHHYVHQRSRESARTFWSGLGAIRAEAFRAVGGFDEAYGMPCVEDIELGLRLADAGGQIRLLKTLQACHLKRWTALDMLRTDLWQRGVPWMRLILARGEAPEDLNTDLASRWSVLLAGCGLLALSAVPVAAAWAWPAVLALGGVVGLNLPFYRFLAGHRGVWFAVRSVPWHVVFFLECGLAAWLGLLLYGRDRWVGRWERRA